MADGKAQSPVDFRFDNCTHDKGLNERSWRFNYNKDDFTRLSNTGHTWEVRSKSGTSHSTVTAAHLPSVYEFVQFHAHWGTDYSNGSEHRLMGKGYAGEIHFVHYNTSYGSIEKAIEHPDGLAVVGVFLQEGEPKKPNPQLQFVTENLSKITEKKSHTDFDVGIDAINLLPSKKAFFTYTGSLTTPPYTECVLWSVYRDPIIVSPGQFRAMREFLPRNDRDCQELNGREIRCSFSYTTVDTAAGPETSGSKICSIL